MSPQRKNPEGGQANGVQEIAKDVSRFTVVNYPVLAAKRQSPVNRCVELALQIERANYRLACEMNRALELAK